MRSMRSRFTAGSLEKRGRAQIALLGQWLELDGGAGKTSSLAKVRGVDRQYPSCQRSPVSRQQTEIPGGQEPAKVTIEGDKMLPERLHARRDPGIGDEVAGEPVPKQFLA